MTSRPEHPARRLLLTAHLGAGLAGLLLALTSLLALGTPGPADAAPVASDGSDWGAQGTLATDSSVTLRWDNVGNPAGSVVQRNRLQVIPHTGGKTYADISSTVTDAYQKYFGSDDGLGGLTVTVSQTTELVDQAITLDFSGVAGGSIVSSAPNSPGTLQVFECWGAPGPDGKPDPDATDPDPATCQVGAGGADKFDGNQQGTRSVYQDPLIKGGDWAKYGHSGDYVPFLTISGEESPGDLYQSNPYVNPTTTNELSHVAFPPSGSTTRSFETQTGSEAPGLGCGYRSDAPSTSTCWLVIVPRVDVVVGGQAGPLSPSIWAQRMQVPLSYGDATTACSNGGARELLAGSEMLTRAASSWTPGVCDSAKVGLGVSQVGDPVARTQYVAGATDAVLTTEPLAASAKADYVPLTLTAPVIGLTLDNKPMCADGSSLDKVTTEAGATGCGYASLADLQADLAVSGQPVNDLRLTPLMVAKLLTQSYQQALMQTIPASVSWAHDAKRVSNLFADPQFTALNPQLHFGPGGAQGDLRLASSLLVEAGRSDAASQIWSWLLADPAASSFLSGCPDASGMTINPFYSSRTYLGCQDQASALEKQATADRDATPKPPAYVDQSIAYPPAGSPYPLPEWYQDPTPSSLPPLSQTDWLPRDDSMALTARDTFHGGKSANTTWCATAVDSSCLPAPGKWTAPKGQVAYGIRQAFTITDSADAARYQLPTASLCDDGGSHCVAANTASLRVASYGFIADQATGLPQPGLADYADGAYPLTMPVYAAVRPTLPADQRTAYADALTYITGAGQQPGFQAGKLPPGYAPLTPALAKQATTAIAALRAGVATTPSTTPSTAPSGSASDTPTSPTSGTPSSAASTPGGPGGAAPPTTPSISAAPNGGASVSPNGDAVRSDALAPAAAGTESWPRYTLPLGLGIALLAGLSGSLLRLRVRLRIK